jgi:hypothetical protein
VTYAGNTSAELFVENDAVPNAGKRSFATAQISPWYVQAVAAVTGMVQDQVAKGGTFEDLLMGELKEASDALLYKVETTLLGSTQDKGVASIIDATDIFAGLDPATYTLWASRETGSISTLDVADMQDMYVGLMGASIGANTSDILCNMNQLKNYSNIQGPATVSSTAMFRGQLPSASNPGPFDIGVLSHGLAFNGIPMSQVRGMTTTEMYWLDMQSPGSDIEFLTIRDLTAEPLAKRNDNTEVLLTMGGALRVSNRKFQGKFTGITA